MILGLLCLGYLSVSFGNVEFFRTEGYRVKAVFSNVTGLKINTSVEMLGIRIGAVKQIHLSDFKAVVTMTIDRSVNLPEDSIATIRTRGLLGEQYVAISPGGLEQTVARDGSGEIIETQPPLIMEEMIGKLMFGGADKKDGGKDAGG
jgi:phospholipid/cholesterol/gamma-HCH transport system substrate-binding protein